MSSREFLRGQVFGFTVAEAVLLILFALLLIYNFETEESQDLKLEKVKFEEIIKKYEDNPEKIVIILDQWHKAVKEELKNKDIPINKYVEMQSLLDTLANDEKFNGTQDEKLTYLQETLKMGYELQKAGFDDKIFQERLETLSLLKQEIDKNKTLSEALRDLENKVSKLEKLKQITRENENLRKKLAKLGGKEGYGTPPCWVNDEGKGIVIFKIKMSENSLQLFPIEDFDSYFDQRLYSEFKNNSENWGEEIEPDTFKDTFSSYLKFAQADKKRECKVWVNVFDCTTNNKSIYKDRVQQVNRNFAIWRNRNCESF